MKVSLIWFLLLAFYPIINQEFYPIDKVRHAAIYLKDKNLNTVLNFSQFVVRDLNNLNISKNKNATGGIQLNACIPSFAVDGNEYDRSYPYIFHANSKVDSYLWVDLEQDSKVQKIEIYNRNDSQCNVRIVGFCIGLYNSNKDLIFEFDPIKTSDLKLEFYTPIISPAVILTTKIRYINLISTWNKNLKLSQIVIRDQNLRNIAYNKLIVTYPLQLNDYKFIVDGYEGIRNIDYDYIKYTNYFIDLENESNINQVDLFLSNNFNICPSDIYIHFIDSNFNIINQLVKNNIDNRRINFHTICNLSFCKVCTNPNICDECVLGASKLKNLCYLHTQPPIGYYYDYDLKIFDLCYISCMYCYSKGNDNDHKCLSCAKTGSNAYYPVIDKPYQCYTKIEGYFLNVNIHELCHKNCKYCVYFGNDSRNNCTECINGLFPLYEEKVLNLFSCYKVKVNYYFDINVFKRCYSKCKNCLGSGNDVKHNCSECIDNLYLIDNTNCFTYSDMIQNNIYFFNKLKNKFEKCNDRCNGCFNKGNDINNNCKKCQNGYLPIYDNQSNCIKDTLYYNMYPTYYKRCYPSYKNCDNIKNNFVCEDNYSIIDKTNSCLISNFNFYGYYYKDNKYYKCPFKCKSCTDDLKCTSCKIGYYLVDQDCYTKQSKVMYYFYSIKDDKFIECYKSCRYCYGLSLDRNNHRCIECDDGYFPTEDNLSNCYDNTKLDYYYLDNGKYLKCYKSCKTCIKGGDVNDHNCESCEDNYYKLGNKCINKYEIINNYHFKDNEFQLNEESCSIGNIVNNIFICHKCNDGFYFIIDNRIKCSKLQDGYYIDGNYLKRCYKSCSECNSSGDINQHNCKKCANDYYMLEENQSMCFKKNSNIPLYVFDSISNIFKKCYVSCLICKDTGDKENNNCIKCNKDYYPLIDLRSKCIKDDEEILYYYYDKLNKIFRKCYLSCEKCNGYGNEYDHQCKKCKFEYYPLIDNTNYCFEKSHKLQNYEFDSDLSLFKRKKTIS